MTSDEPLYKQLSIDPAEGLICAYIPAQILQMEEFEVRSGDRYFTLYAHRTAWDNVVLDAMPSDSKNVKWWLVKELARSEGLSWVEPFWSGPAGEFDVRWLPDVPRPERSVMAIRQYSRGPWIKLPDKDTNDRPAPAATLDS